MDALNNDIPLASTGAGSPSEGYPKLINGVLSTRFKLVGPYSGSTDGLLAMELGETDGALTSWNTLNTARHDWIVDKKIRVLVQYALQRTTDTPNVPTMVELGKTPEDKAMFAFYVSGGYQYPDVRMMIQKRRLTGRLFYVFCAGLYWPAIIMSCK